MRETALITGASSGIGLEIARLLAAKKYDLILVARRKERLLDLKDDLEVRHGIAVHVMPADLSKPESAAQLFAQVKSKEIVVSMLVNNAGFGTYGSFLATEVAEQQDMIQVNITSLVALCRLFGGDMKTRNSGRILNVASILSFFPFPYYTTYAASKAFVLSFSEALRTELRGTGVTVTCLCPGPTDTEFNTPEILSTNAYKTMKPIEAREVARQGVDALLQGKMTKVVGWMNKLTASTPRFTPRGLSVRINKYMASQRK